MKKTLLFIVIALAFVACNKIEGPYVIQSQKEDVDVDFPELDYDAVYRKILFDEYTGHTCIGCPEGHVILEQLQAQFGDTLVAVGIHANWFAEPEAGLFSYDFRTPTGEQLYLDYHIANNPQAIVNRSTVPLDKPEWATNVRTADRTKYAAIQIINQYDAATQKLKINTKTTMLEDYNRPTQLSLLLVEDNIIKPQKFNDHVDTFYVHNHVLRAGINGNYGEYIISGGLLEKDGEYLYGYSLDFNGTDWNPDNCSVIAILLDEQNKKVIQVEKAAVR